MVGLTLVIGSPPPAECQAGERRNEVVVPAATPASPLAVALVSDCGVEMDNQWALAHLPLGEGIALRAVVTTHASSIGFPSAASAKTAAEVMARVLPAAGSPRPCCALAVASA